MGPWRPRSASSRSSSRWRSSPGALRGSAPRRRWSCSSSASWPRSSRGCPTVELDPELVLVGLLPPLLYAAAIRTSLVDFRANRDAIVLLSVGLVVVTTVGVGLVSWRDRARRLAGGGVRAGRRRRAAGRRGGDRGRPPGRHAAADRHRAGGREPGQRRDRAGRPAHRHRRDRVGTVGAAAGARRIPARGRRRGGGRARRRPRPRRRAQADRRTRSSTRRSRSWRPSWLTCRRRRSARPACSPSS